MHIGNYIDRTRLPRPSDTRAGYTASVGALTYRNTGSAWVPEDGANAVPRRPIAEPVNTTAATTNTGLVNSSIAVGTTRMWDSGSFGYPCGLMVKAGPIYPWEIAGRHAHITSPLIQQDFVSECQFAGTKFEAVVVNCKAGVGRVRFLLDDKIVSPGVSITLAGADGDVLHVLGDFGAMTAGSLRIEGAYALFVGLRTMNSAGVQPADYSGQPLMISFGDSYEESTGATWPWEGQSWRLARALGFRRHWSSGLGSTGFVATVQDKLNYLDRYGLDVLPYKPDLVHIGASINDEQSPLLQVKTNAANLIAQHQRALPRCGLLMTGVQLRQSVNDDANNEVVRLLSLDNGIPFADPLTGRGGRWFTGTGKFTGQAGDGTRDWALGDDGKHLTALGNDFAATQKIRSFRLF